MWLRSLLVSNNNHYLEINPETPYNTVNILILTLLKFNCVSSYMYVENNVDLIEYLNLSYTTKYILQLYIFNITPDIYKIYL